MSHALGVQADSTGEWGGAVSFATKEEAIAYIVTLAPRGTSLFDIPVVESVDPAADRQGDLGQDTRIGRPRRTAAAYSSLDLHDADAD